MMLDSFLQAYDEGIHWVRVIDSWKPWKRIGILALTHGNEPVGLQLFEFLQDELKVQELLQAGQLILVVVNPLAYQHQQRFIDHNMNRISTMPYQDESYEFERFEVLKPLLQKMDVVIDVHSFSSSDDQVVICDLENRKQCEEIFEAEVILLDKLQESWSLIGYSHRHGGVAYGIECGQHQDPRGYAYGKREICNLLCYYGLLPMQYRSERKAPAISYQFKMPIKPCTQDFHFTQEFRGFTPLAPGELFAKDQEREYRNTLEWEIYLGIPAKHPQANDGAGFLFEKLE